MSSEDHKTSPKGINRKQFFKFGALAALFGLGGKGAFNLYATAGGPAASESENQQQKKVRWGMAIDSSRCKEGCSDCIDACHLNHNVPDHGNPKDEVKWIWKEPAKHLFPETDFALQGGFKASSELLALCNHCENPACVRVCPTQATWKSKSDGIVMMDYHRCIGCRFCMAGCPYGSRSFNFKDPRAGLENLSPGYPTRTTGVVEKCNFCADIVGEHGCDCACL